MLLSQRMPHASAWSQKEIETLRQQYYAGKLGSREQTQTLARHKPTEANNPWLRQTYVI